MKKPILVGILIFAALIALIAYSTMNMAQHKVEICITFKGNSNCRTASGATQEAALRAATTNACADLSSGVTEVLACERTEPSKTTWIK